MSRWFLLLLSLSIPACDSTFDPAPPGQLHPQVRAISMETTGTSTGYVTELEPNSLTNVHVSGLPLRYDAEGNELPPTLPTSRDVAVGDAHACVVSATSTVHCWGDHARGALGPHRACTPPAMEGEEPDCVLDALAMPTLPPVRELAAGDDVTCATLADDRVVCWGEPGPKLGGSVLPSLDPPTPVERPDGTPLLADRVMIWRSSVCAITRDRKLWCWGENFAATPTLQPQTGVVDLALGTRHSCMIDDRGLSCWGDNRNGQVGDVAAARQCHRDAPCKIDQPHPIAIDATRVIVGERHTCALRRDGLVACWGSNEVGQLGRSDAFLVGDIGLVVADVIDLVGGYARTCALRVDGSAWCWGSTDAQT